MLPANFPLSLYRGDTVRYQFVLWEDAAKTTPLDLTDVTAKAEIRDKPGSVKTVVVFECEVEQPNIINMTLDAADARKLPAKGAWDLQLNYASGDVVTILAGEVATTNDVTEST